MHPVLLQRQALADWLAKIPLPVLQDLDRKLSKKASAHSAHREIDDVRDAERLSRWVAARAFEAPHALASAALCKALGVDTGAIEQALSSNPLPESELSYDHAARLLGDVAAEAVRLGVCDAITIYLQDCFDPEEYVLAGHHGLDQPELMYGPRVYDDRRNTRAGRVTFTPHSGDGASRFAQREHIKSMLDWSIAIEESRLACRMFLNWRRQTDVICRRCGEELLATTTSILSKIRGPSSDQTDALQRELRARRFVDMSFEPRTNNKEVLAEAFRAFFRGSPGNPLDRSDTECLGVALVATSEGIAGDVVRSIGEHAKHLYSVLVPDQESVREVALDTRPILHRSPNRHLQPLPRYVCERLILPIRTHPGARSSRGVVSISSTTGGILNPSCVKPLYSLADHIGALLYR